MKLTFWWFCFLIFCFLSTTSFSQNYEKLVKEENLSFDENLFYKGNQAILEKDFQTALNIFNEYLKRNKTDEQAYLLRSEAHYFFKNYKEVVKDCKKVFKLGPYPSETDYTAMWNIANGYIGLGKYNLALDYLEICKKHNPNKIKFYEVSAYTYFAKRDFESAIKELQQLATIDPKSGKAYYGIGRALFHQNKMVESLEYYNKSIELDSTYALAYENRAVVKLALKDYEGYCQDVKKCIKLGMKHIEGTMNIYCD